MAVERDMARYGNDMRSRKETEKLLAVFITMHMSYDDDRNEQTFTAQITRPTLSTDLDGLWMDISK